MVERMRILFDALFLRSWPFFLLLLVTLFCFYVCSVSFYTNLESKNLNNFLKKSAQNTNALSINTCNLSFLKSSLYQTLKKSICVEIEVFFLFELEFSVCCTLKFKFEAEFLLICTIYIFAVVTTSFETSKSNWKIKNAFKFMYVLPMSKLKATRLLPIYE